MALQSPEMRALYDLKVFVVCQLFYLASSWWYHADEIELRFRLDVGKTHKAGYQRTRKRYRRYLRSGKLSLVDLIRGCSADMSVPPFRQEQL